MGEAGGSQGWGWSRQALRMTRARPSGPLPFVRHPSKASRVYPAPTEIHYPRAKLRGRSECHGRQKRVLLRRRDKNAGYGRPMVHVFCRGTPRLSLSLSVCLSLSTKSRNHDPPPLPKSHPNYHNLSPPHPRSSPRGSRISRHRTLGIIVVVVSARAPATAGRRGRPTLPHLSHNVRPPRTKIVTNNHPFSPLTPGS